jgi:hypothetical protein
MKKLKKGKSIFDQKVRLTIVERLNNVKMGPYELRKLEEANYHLLKMKSLPK